MPSGIGSAPDSDERTLRMETSISGSLDGINGSLTKWSTFRYHERGSISIAATWPTYSAFCGFGAYIRFGLHTLSSNWVQVGNTLEVSWSQRNQRRYFSNSSTSPQVFAAGSYALMGRTKDSRHSSGTDHGSTVNFTATLWY